MLYWAMLESSVEAYHAYVEKHVVSAEELQAFTEGHQAVVTRVADGVAQIPITGVLTPEPDIIAELFMGGNTTYPGIRQALAAAEANSQVDSIELIIDSPGGDIVGLFETLDAINAVEKPVRAVGMSVVASAAYAIASQANDIQSTSRMSIWGSIGIVTSRRINNSVVDITSSNAPNKRPDVSTEEGVETVRAELDQIEGEFISAIATGRNVAEDVVKADFGQGGVMIGKYALASGLIDGIVSTSTETSASEAQEPTESVMDITKLKAEHPELYNAVKAEGAEDARKTVLAHIELGKAAGAKGVELALENIEAGADFDQLVSAKYQAAALTNQAQESRTADDDEAQVTVDDKTGAKGKDQETSDHEAYLKEFGPHKV